MKFKSWVMLLRILALFLLIPVFTLAGDTLYRLTHNDQYTLVLGSVTAVNKGGITLAVSKTLSGHWVWGEINIVNSPELHVTLKAGTKLLASLNRDRKAGAGWYSTQWGLYRVSSLYPATLRILESDLALGDRAALEYYIRSGGQDKDFFFIEKTAFLRYPDGTISQIYPEPINNKGRSVRERVIIHYDRESYSSALSSAPGIGLYPVYINQMNRPVRYCWRTNFGVFLSWSAHSYQVKQLGKETALAEGAKIYWSPPLSQGQGGLTKTRARVELSVTDQKTGKIIGKSMIFINCKEGMATVE